MPKDRKAKNQVASVFRLEKKQPSGERNSSNPCRKKQIVNGFPQFFPNHSRFITMVMKVIEQHELSRNAHMLTIDSIFLIRYHRRIDSLVMRINFGMFMV
jgi:hypothetical protein